MTLVRFQLLLRPRVIYLMIVMLHMVAKIENGIARKPQRIHRETIHRPIPSRRAAQPAEGISQTDHTSRQAFQTYWLRAIQARPGAIHHRSDRIQDRHLGLLASSDCTEDGWMLPGLRPS